MLDLVELKSNDFFAIIDDVIANLDDLTIRSHNQLKKAWKKAESTQTPVSVKTFVLCVLGNLSGP